MESFAPQDHQKKRTVHLLNDEMLHLQTLDCTSDPLREVKDPLKQIELYCRIICYGFTTPFPDSRPQLPRTLHLLKHQLRALTLHDLLSPSMIESDEVDSALHDELTIVEPLQWLLSLPVYESAMPSLKNALRFVHHDDQMEIFMILHSKLLPEFEAF